MLNHVVGNRDATHKLLEAKDVGSVHHLCDRCNSARCCGLHNGDFFIVRWVIQKQVEHETVELCFWKRVRTLLFDWVLCSEHEERLFETIRCTRGGYGILLHGFEQSSLRLWRRAVDFVGQHDVGKDWPLDKAKCFLAGGSVLFDHFGTGNVARHQIGRELHAREGQVHGVSHRANEQCLGKTRHTDQQTVSAGEECNQELLDNIRLSNDNLCDLGGCRTDPVGEIFDTCCISHDNGRFLGV